MEAKTACLSDPANDEVCHFRVVSGMMKIRIRAEPGQHSTWSLDLDLIARTDTSLLTRSMVPATDAITCSFST